MPLLLLMLVSFGAGANPDVNRVSSHHVTRSLFQSKDHFDEAAINAAHVGTETHELHREGRVLGATLGTLKRYLQRQFLIFNSDRIMDITHI